MSPERLFLHNLFARREGLKLLSSGFYHKNYIFKFAGKDYVLRVSKQSKQYDLRTFDEAAVISFLNDAGFRGAPRVVYSSTCPSFSVLEYVFGKVPSKGFAARAATELLGRLHAVDMFGFKAAGCSENFHDRYEIFALKQMREYKWCLKTFYPGLSNSLQDAFARLEIRKFRPHCLLHGDPARSNLIVQPSGQMYLVDFEFATKGDPLFDYAILANRSLAADAAALNKLIDSLKSICLDFDSVDEIDLFSFAMKDAIRSMHVVAAKYILGHIPVTEGRDRLAELTQHVILLKQLLSDRGVGLTSQENLLRDYEK